MPKTSDNLLQACQTIFGVEAPLQEDFLAELRSEYAKSAYRSQIKQHHPDHYEKAPLHIRRQQTERFRAIHQAYRVIEEFLAIRQLPQSQSPVASDNRQRPTGAARAMGRHKNGTRPASDIQGSAIPNIPLEFGMFAYYSGKVPYGDLIRGLAWQRRQRPAIGAIAVQWGWLTDHQIRSILEHPGPSRRFGRKAIELRYLQPRQVEALLAYQRTHQRRLGEFFIRRRLLNRDEAEELARRLDSHNARVRRSL